MFGAAWPGFDFDFGFLLKNWLTSHIVGRVLRAWEACTRAGGRRGADYYIFKNIQRYADCRGVQSCIVNLVASSIIIYMYGISRMHDERACIAWHRTRRWIDIDARAVGGGILCAHINSKINILNFSSKYGRTCNPVQLYYY